MATTVVYGNNIKSLTLGDSAGTTTSGSSTGTQLIGSLSTYLGGVTKVQQINNSASTTNPTATFTNTPTQGNAMIAIVIRGGDNVASTNSSWTLLTSQGVASTRRLEIWWRRAGASESKTHTWTNATAALWEVTMVECGGWATVTSPTVILAGTNVASRADYTMPVAGPFGVGAIVTSGGSAGTFTVGEPLLLGGFLESVGALPVTTTTRFVPLYADAYVNYPDDNASAGEARAYTTWTTNRAFTAAMVGWREGSTKGPVNGFATVGQAVFSNTAPFGQTKLAFDTSAIPASNTVSSATLSLKSSTISGWPADTTVDAYKISSGVTLSLNNTPTWWQTSTNIGSLTRVASRAAGSTWNTSTVYDWTSDAAFPAQITKAGTTSLLLVTGDQAAGTGSARTNANFCFPSGTASDHYLTIVHSFLGSATVAATAGLTPTISRTVAYARSIAASLAGTPAISRTLAYARSITSSVTTSPTVTTGLAYLRTITTSIGLTPTILTARAYLRTIASTLGLTPSVTGTKIPFVAQVARVIRLGGRSTIQLVQTVTARLGGRSTIRAPKE